MRKFYAARFVHTGWLMAFVFSAIFLDLSPLAALVVFVLGVLLWPPTLYIAEKARDHYTNRRH